jgi:aryl-alcohol dehydrogenase-like predicted oxidoreductase
VQHCAAHSITFLACAPVGGLRQQETVAESDVLRRVGQSYGASSQEVALAWLLAKAPNIVPIPGATRIASVRSSARAAQMALSASDRDAIDKAFEIFLGTAV